MADKPSPIRPTDEEARQLARHLITTSTYISLATLDPGTGWPLVTRTLVATEASGIPFILVSSLAHHTRCLLADNRCSFMAGEPGKGDPLAHARVTVSTHAKHVAADDPEHTILRSLFLERHPKSALYIDFPDFSFFRLHPVSAALNGGFGKAFQLESSDLIVSS